MRVESSAWMGVTNPRQRRRWVAGNANWYYCGEIAVPRVCLARGLGFARMVPMNVWSLGAWRLSVSLCSRASVWVPVARNWHYLAWSHSSVGKEDQLALDAGGLKSCPLSDNSGQRSISACDGLSAYDPGCVKTRSVCLWAA